MRQFITLILLTIFSLCITAKEPSAFERIRYGQSTGTNKTTSASSSKTSKKLSEKEKKQNEKAKAAEKKAAAKAKKQEAKEKQKNKEAERKAKAEERKEATKNKLETQKRAQKEKAAAVKNARELKEEANKARREAMEKAKKESLEAKERQKEQYKRDLREGKLWKKEKVTFLDSTSRKDTTLINLFTLNSPMNDYQPFAFGKQLVFTSDRYRVPETLTEEWTEKVYNAKQKGKMRWSKQHMNGYKWISDNNTALVGVDDYHFYFYRCYWPENGQLFQSSRIIDQEKGKRDKRKPWNVGRLDLMDNINSDADETSIATIGEDSIFFVSDRSGNYDIYFQVRNSAPRPLYNLNTPYDENDLHYWSQTRTLYFSSNRPGGAGGYDIYKTHVNSDGTCTDPVWIADTMVNSPADDRDFHRDCDSIIFFASNRKGGLGNLDIYQISITTLGDSVIPVTKEDTIDDLRDELVKKLMELGLFPFKGEVQVGAYRYIKSLKDFYKRFPCIKGEDLKEVEIVVDGSIHVHKYIVNKIYDDVEEALEKQYQIEKLHCLPDEEFSDMPFIGCLDKNGNRYAIFWKKGEIESHNIYHIYKNGKIIWKSRKF